MEPRSVLPKLVSLPLFGGWGDDLIEPGSKEFPDVNWTNSPRARVGFLSLGAVGIWGRSIFAVGDALRHCRMLPASLALTH